MERRLHPLGPLRELQQLRRTSSRPVAHPRTAPELKRCLVKRLHEYIVAENQTIDRGYLDYLTREFEAEAATNSSAAVKNTIVRIVKSDTYSSAMPSRSAATTCAGLGRGQGPPCRVAFILRSTARSATARRR